MHTEFFFEEACTQNFLPVELASLEQNNNQGFLLDHHTRWIQYTIPTFSFFFEMNHLKLQWIFCYKFSWSSLIIEIQYDIWLATNPVSSTPKITRRLCSNRKLVHVAGAWLGLIYFSKDSVGCMDPQVFRSGPFFEVLVFFLKFDSDKHTFCLLYLGSWEIHWWHIWFTIF